MKRSLLVFALVILFSCLSLSAGANLLHAEFEFKGIDYTGWHRGDLSSANSNQALGNISGVNADSVALCIFWFVPDNDYDNIYQDQSCSPSDEDVLNAINRIRSLGMKVVLKLHLNIMHANQEHEGSGIINPSNVGDINAYFLGYYNFVMHYANLLHDHGITADLFCFGTELTGMSSSNYDYWHIIIDHLKSVQNCPVTYAAGYSMGLENPCFKDLLDYVGVDCYVNLSDAANPSLEELIQGWTNYQGQNWVQELDTYREGKPLIFTEIGYRSKDYAAYNPWDYSPGGTYNGDLQARCYQAFFEVFRNVDWFKGSFWWLYITNPYYGGTGNTDYTPNQKPAADTLTSYYYNYEPPPPHGQDPTIMIYTDRVIYRPGDWFNCNIKIDNPGDTRCVNVYIALEVYGFYWFWPQWQTEIDFQAMFLAEASQQITNILSFIWPEGAGSASGIRFWTALTDPESGELFGNVSMCEFGFEEGRQQSSIPKSNKVFLSEEAISKGEKIIIPIKNSKKRIRKNNTLSFEQAIGVDNLKQ